MADTLAQFRTDEASRVKVLEICEGLGIDLQTYLRILVQLTSKIA